MTSKIRRRVFLSMVVLALALPTEIMMLRVLATPSQQDAVRQWVGGLEAAALDQAVSEIQAYPYAYRRELMRALSPERRAGVWRDHVRDYAAAHRELDGSARDLLRAVESAIAVDLFTSEPTEVSRASIRAVGQQVVAMLGRDAADYLLLRLGDVDAKSGSAEPMAMRIENWLRGTFAALAQAADCDCSTSWGGCPQGTYCNNIYYCAPDNDWPMCGWLWQEACDGQCRVN